MICPAVISNSHSSRDKDIRSVTGSDNDIVEEGPVLGARVLPSGLVFVALPEDGIGDGKPMLCTLAEVQL